MKKQISIPKTEIQIQQMNIQIVKYSGPALGGIRRPMKPHRHIPMMTQESLPGGEPHSQSSGIKEEDTGNKLSIQRGACHAKQWPGGSLSSELSTLIRP